MLLSKDEFDGRPSCHFLSQPCFFSECSLLYSTTNLHHTHWIWYHMTQWWVFGLGGGERGLVRWIHDRSSVVADMVSFEVA